MRVGREALITLTQGSLRDTEGIQALEEAAAELYKALQASRDRGEFGGSVLNFSSNMTSDMAATMERLEEYRTHNAQFCKRLYEYSCIMFTAQVRFNPSLNYLRGLRLFLQSTLLLGDSSGLLKPGGRGRPEIMSHKDLESHLDRYSGLVLYTKEMDEVTYGKLCAVSVSYCSASLGS